MTDGYHEEWTDQLSDYLSEELDEAARARLEKHLSGCVRCRDALVGLREVVALAGAVEPLEPPRDLWPDISAALEARGSQGADDESDVIALPTATGRPTRLAVAPARLAVAAAALVLVSVATTWAVASGTPPVTEPATVAAGPVGDGAATMASDDPIPPDLAAELGVLEDVLASERSTLDSATVAVLERNMRTIQTAIDDSRRALAGDPNNAFLAEHLERMYRRKLVYLQEAVRVAEWAS